MPVAVPRVGCRHGWSRKMWAMAWLESHQQLERHPKTNELIRLMGWDAEDSPIRDVAVDVAIGKLHRFWYWCLDYAPTGDLRGKNDSLIAKSVGLAPSDGKRFIEAMVESCWIDRSKNIFRVHDWNQYAGRYLKESKFKNHPEKIEEMEAVYRPRIIQGRSKLPTNIHNQHNQPTKPDPTRPEFFDLIPASLQTARFVASWREFEQHRIEIKPRLTPTSAKRALAKLAKFTEDECVEAIDQSIASGWKGIFPRKLRGSARDRGEDGCELDFGTDPKKADEVMSAFNEIGTQNG